MSDILLRTFMTLAERGLRLRMVVTVGGVTIRGTLVDEYFEQPPSAHCIN